MDIIRPLTVLDAMLDSSNVTEADETEWASGTRVIGDVRMVTTTANGASVATHDIYTANTTTGADPTLAANQGAGNGWDKTGTTNRWNMFNAVLQEQTSFATLIDISVTPGEVINSLAFFNLDANSIDIEVNDPVDGVVYTNTINLVSFSGITDWYSYFYEPIVRETNAADLSLPAFPAATINIDINISSGNAKCGAVVFGSLFEIGDSQHGANFGITDFSTKTTAASGSVTVTAGAFSDIADVQVICDSQRFTEIKTTLTSLRSVPLVWIPELTVSGSFIYGYYRNFNLAYSGPVKSTVLLEIEGLI